MSSFLRYLPFGMWEQSRLPEVLETDEIIPVHLFDDSAAARGIVLVWTFQFDDVLDSDKLYTTLSQLFQMEGWRKLSGRFRSKPDGGLELYVPATFSEERPAVYYTKEIHNDSIKNHPLASKLPQPTGKVSTYPGPKDFCGLGLGPGTPHNIDEYITSGKPQFCLHVQSFTDATLVSVTHSHVSSDLMGFASILEAWSLVLAGKSEMVKPMVGYREDAFNQLWNPHPPQNHVLEHKILGGWRMKYWGLHSLFDSWRSDDVHSRTLCIPRHVMDNMLLEARSHLVAEVDTSGSKTEAPFISEGDVVTALACRVLAQYLGPQCPREMATIIAVDPRSRVKSVFREGTAYVQNSPTNIYFFSNASEALELPLGRLALLVRETIATQTTEEQLKATAYLSVRSMKENKMPIIFGDKDMVTQFMSNWTKGDLAQRMDFSPAILRETNPGRATSERGHPVYYQASDPAQTKLLVISNLFVVMGKDYGGNLWLSITLPGQVWSNLMEYLEKFA